MIDYTYVTPGGKRILVKATVLYTMPGYKVIKYINPITLSEEEAVFNSKD